jgi:large-conductance mechanosensitive channel
MQSPLAHAVLGALIDLNKPARIVHWHFFQMSVANIVVIAVMIFVLVLAIVLPFPARRRVSR